MASTCGLSAMARVHLKAVSSPLNTLAVQASRRVYTQRWQSTHSTGSSSSTSSNLSSSHRDVDGSAPLPPPHRRSKGPPSRHKLFYRDIIPPLFRVLAYGSAVYFSLHLVWQYLDGKEQKQLEDQVKQEMEAQVRQTLQSKGVVAEHKNPEESRSWWGRLSGRG